MPPALAPLFISLHTAARRLLAEADRLPGASAPAAVQTAPRPLSAPVAAECSAPPQNRSGKSGGAPGFPLSLPGIDADNAIAALCVTPEIFENILVLFCRNNSNAMGLIEQACGEKDWQTVKKLAHAVKGSAANIRATALSQSAQALENAAEHAAVTPAAPGPSKAERSQMAADLALVLDGIAAAGIAPAPKPPDQGHRRVDRSRLGALMRDFMEVLDLAVPEEIRQHQEKIRPYLHHLAMANIEAAVQQYDYDDAQEQIRAIAGDMNIPIRASAFLPGELIR
jgi:HPt (histidine-containing phosphotransfer) domain-containing protein